MSSLEPASPQGPSAGVRPGGSTALLVVVGLVVVVVLGGLAAALAVAWTSDPEAHSGAVTVEAGPPALAAGATASTAPAQGEATAPVTVSGEVLPPMPQLEQPVTDGSNDPAIGLVAPTLTGTDFAGNEVVITADGQPKVVYFLAHWCPHCQAEVPVIQDLLNQGVVPGVKVYAVSTSVKPDQGNYPPAAWLEREGFTPPTLRDDANNTALFAYGGGGFPFAVYLDGDNKVLARSAGELGVDGIVPLWTLTATSAPAPAS